MPELHLDGYIDRKTLILGDVNTGKTTLTRRVLEALCRRGLGGRIAVVDMAPEIPKGLAEGKGIPGVGGKLTPPGGQGVLYLGGRLEPPRLGSKNEAEALKKACENRRIIDGLFRELQPREILLVNDASIYLQAGSAEDLIPWFERADTVVANGYWGHSVGEGVLTEREKVGMEKLKAYFERRGRVLIL